MDIAVITGSAGLIGSESVRFFAARGFEIVGVDNDMRKYFFGDEASTAWNAENLKENVNGYHHYDADIIIRAIAKVSQKHKIKLLMVGDGADRTRMETLAKKLDIDATFTGHIDNIPEAIASADIGTISFRDNMLNRCKCPLRLFEYMSSGLPIVSTKVGEPSHILQNNSGLLVDSDSDSIANGILTLLEDKILAAQFSKNGRELILKKYNWQTLGQKLVKFYESVTIN